MNFKNSLMLILAASLLTGCGIYTDYHRQDVHNTDSLYRGVTADVEDTLMLSDISWRELFADTLLARWIETGLEHNSDIQIARLQTEEVQASLRASRLAILPSLSLNPQGSLSSYGGEKPAKTYSLGVAAEWEVDAFGGLRNAMKGTQASVEASRAYEQAVQTQLIATIAEAYYSLLSLDRKLAITRETAQQWGESVRVMKALKRAGEANEAAVAQAEASRLEAETAVITLTKQIKELENTFSALVGVAPSDIERGSILELPFKERWAEGIPVRQLSRRPDVRQAEWRLAQAFYATNEARSAFYPKITLSGTAGWTNNSGAGIVNPGEWLLNAVGSLVQPLFSRGRNTANLKIARAQQQEAQIAFSQKLLDAGTEANNALSRWQAARMTAELDRKKVEALQTAVNSTQLMMRHGSTNYLEVLTAQQTLLQAQLAEVADKYEEIQGAISLYHALGGGVR
ncbi:MAG: TolC family protein [Prevotella sp.]